MDFRKGTMTDDAFGSKLTAVIVSIGDIADADGVLVMDMEGADGDKVRKFLDALPNMKGKVTVTGDDVRLETKKGISPWVWGLGLAALVGFAVWKKRE
jgi:hypothetical protein